MPKGFGYGGESANQEKKNLNKDMPVVKQASWMSKHSMAAGSPVAMGGSYKGSAMEMHKPGHIDPKSGQKLSGSERRNIQEGINVKSPKIKALYEEYKKTGGKLTINEAARIGFASPEESKRRQKMANIPGSQGRDAIKGL